MALLHRLFGSAWLPHLVLLGLALAWIASGGPFPAPWAEWLTDYAEYAIAAVGSTVAVLALLYRQANVAFQAAIAVLAFFALGHATAAELAVALVAVLAPLNYFALTLLDERGLLSRAGLLRLAAVGGQAALVVATLEYAPAFSRAITDTTLLPEVLRGGYNLPDQAMVIACATATVMLGLAIAQPLPSRVGALSALLALLIGLELTLASNRGLLLPALFTLLALALLLLAILQEAHRLAFRDGLTGLPNRRAMDTLLASLGGRYTIAMMDVDRFKAFNDTHGHDVGDQVLRRVARSVGRVGQRGRPFRYGGEEFSVVFPGQEVEAVVPALEAVREEIAATPFRIRSRHRPADDRRGSRRRGQGAEQAVPITISIGVAGTGEEATSPEEVVQAADQALYRAKRAGRNRLAQ